MIYNDEKKLNELSETSYPHLKNAIRFMEALTNRKLEDGKYDIDAEKVYANVESYIPRRYEDTCFESHEKYIDIQYVLQGKEVIQVVEKGQLKIKKQYDKERDIVFYEQVNLGEKIEVRQGEFLVLLPDDAHRPGIRCENSVEQVKKMVIKVAVN